MLMEATSVVKTGAGGIFINQNGACASSCEGASVPGLADVRTGDACYFSRPDPIDADTVLCYHFTMKRKHQRILELVFSRPVSANVRWADIEALLRELGAEFEEREGSRVEVFLFGLVRVFHRPHPSPDTDKGAVAAIRKWLEDNGVKP